MNFFSHDYKFINVYYFNNESDWLSFLPSGYCYEVEIKISRSDFKADFKKEKHRLHNSNTVGRKTYLVRQGTKLLHEPNWELCKAFPELIIAQEHFNHWSTKKREFESRVTLRMEHSSMIDFRTFANEKLPNKFFYAVPEGMISKDEVPDYAGLLYIDENLKVTKVKDGKFIHKDILDVKKLFKKTYYAYESFVRNNFNNKEIKAS
ncbi:hypothetical protein [Epilithonimonas caeni]|uniref:hypothetical protein n=1 Tax=Epilithonimonas caeni TaxID=365343 RepID=UPI0012EB42A3|nr:hypothetical protein [Epilithonimonas caeni]